MNQYCNRVIASIAEDNSINFIRLIYREYQLVVDLKQQQWEVAWRYFVSAIGTTFDFSAIRLTLEKHANAVFQNLPHHDLKGIKLQFFEALPMKFDRQDYLKVAEELRFNTGWRKTTRG